MVLLRIRPLIFAITTEWLLRIDTFKTYMRLADARHVWDEFTVSRWLGHKTSLNAAGCICVLQGLFFLYLEMICVELVVPIKRHKLLLRLLLHSLKLIIFIFVSKIQRSLTEVLNALFDRHGVHIVTQVVLFALFVAGSPDSALFVSWWYTAVNMIIFNDGLLVDIQFWSLHLVHHGILNYIISSRKVPTFRNGVSLRLFTWSGIWWLTVLLKVCVRSWLKLLSHCARSFSAGPRLILLVYLCRLIRVKIEVILLCLELW